MAEPPSRPLLKPVLRFKKGPRPGHGSIGGKSADSVKKHRLDEQRKVLSKAFREMDDTVANQPSFSDHVVIHADMFEDSLAPSHTPYDLFHMKYGAQLITPYRTGYLVEVQADCLSQLADQIEQSEQGKEKADISRVQSAVFFNEQNATTDRTSDNLWEEAPEIENGRAFVIWLMPLRNKNAQEDLIQKVFALQNESISSPPSLSQKILENLDASVSVTMRRSLQVAANEDDRITLAIRDYQKLGHAIVTVIIPSKVAIDRLLASGAVLRIDPINPIASTTPGSGVEPNPPLRSDMSGLPIVGVVDGGMTANSYKPAEAWRAPPFIPNEHAAAEHGNQVTSLIVQGHEWNNDLNLPSLSCQVGTAQAVPKRGAPPLFDPQLFITYLDTLMSEYTNTRVWNFSLNFKKDCPTDSVNPLSHDIAMLARKHKILPIISIGNKPGYHLQPPADCEAAITVGGRQQSLVGCPAGKCDISLKGPGPSNMLKPELSNFSKVRLIGGAISEGSSFATALTSPMAAHTMASLRDASPDLVKALLLHNADLDKFDPNLGFGTPNIDPLPWLCRPGFVTLQWTAKLRAGNALYWEVPIPASLRKTGKLKGAGILTAILNPHPMVSVRAGMNYFSVRVATALKFERGQKNGSPAFHSLLGSVDTERLTEKQAREKDYKWSPVRHYKKSFPRGIKFDGENLRVYARLFHRDSYLYEMNGVELTNTELETVFVLSIGTRDGSDDIYDEICSELGAFVESAVIDSEIDIGDDNF